MEQIRYKGLHALRLENEYLALTFLPDYACKMASLFKKDTGREFLFQSARDVLTPPPYGAAFSDYDSSGFDEVLPSIDACPYPCGTYLGTPVPDHGEVWALPWEHTVHADGNGLTARVQSPKLPYRFTRELILSAMTSTCIIHWKTYQMSLLNLFGRRTACLTVRRIPYWYCRII